MENKTSDLTFKALADENLKRCNRWHPNGVDEWTLSDWGVAAGGEMGEALNVIKKLKREQDGIKGNDKTARDLKLQLCDELADTVIYIDLLAQRAGINLENAIKNKFNRVSRKNGFPERL